MSLLMLFHGGQSGELSFTPDVKSYDAKSLKSYMIKSRVTYDETGGLISNDKISIKIYQE